MIEMQEIDSNELTDVNGGIAPLVIGAWIILGYMTGVTAMTVGAVAGEMTEGS
jgi:lactobin A/cerein 7B family class IIb bacteriocin